MPWRAHVLTLFPEMFPGPLGVSLVGTALREGRWSLETLQIRDFGIGRHKAVDDTPAGGGAGMVMRADVLAAALDHARAIDPVSTMIYLSPRGRPLTQARVRSLAQGPGVILLAGRFEGVDQRVIDGRQLEEISIGDYVLSGGEIATMALIDACVRLLPGVLGGQEFAVGGELRERFVGISPVHPAARLGRSRHPRHAALWRSQKNRGVAAR